MKLSINYLQSLVIIGFVMLSGLMSSGIHAQAETRTPGAPVLVMPFKVSPVQENAHQWLGRAVSFYITSGLKQNNFQVLPDHHTIAMLEMDHIRFPYTVTKASVMRLARKYQLSHVIWGEITLEKGSTDKEENDQSLIQLKAFVIDLSNYSQKYLPLIKGHINDLYTIKDELLTAVVKALKPVVPGDHTRYPGFNLNHRNYEIFIKSLLIKDISKRIQLLEKAQKASEGVDSDLLNFELAVLYFDRGNLDAAGELLDKIPADKENPQPLFKHEKTFLKGMIAYAKEDIAAALEAFTLLQQENQFNFEVYHNLGVIYTGKNDYKAAESFLQRALGKHKDPGTWLNLIHVLLAGDDSRQAALQLKQALRLYPQEEKLVEMLFYFISRSQDKELLFSVFQNYIPNLFLGENPPEVSLKLKSPFRSGFPGPFAGTDSGDPDENPGDSPGDDIDSSIERLQGLLEMNPFEPRYYRSISLMYLKKKQYDKAKLHALALVFLEETRENYLHLVKVYKSMGDKKKANEIKKEIDVLFSSSGQNSM